MKQNETILYWKSKLFYKKEGFLLRMGKKVSLRKIAQESGYALCTVSRALNSSAPVAEYTRKKVLAAAHKLGYLTSPRKQRIAIIVNDVYFNTKWTS